MRHWSRLHARLLFLVFWIALWATWAMVALTAGATWLLRGLRVLPLINEPRQPGPKHGRDGDDHAHDWE